MLSILRGTPLGTSFERRGVEKKLAVEKKKGLEEKTVSKLQERCTWLSSVTTTIKGKESSDFIRRLRREERMEAKVSKTKGGKN